MSAHPGWARWRVGRIEDVRWMIEGGADLYEVAQRLRITMGAVERFCIRHGLTAELDTLRDRRELSPAALHAQTAGLATAKSRRLREAS